MKYLLSIILTILTSIGYSQVKVKSFDLLSMTKEYKIQQAFSEKQDQEIKLGRGSRLTIDKIKKIVSIRLKTAEVNPIAGDYLIKSEIRDNVGNFKYYVLVNKLTGYTIKLDDEDINRDEDGILKLEDKEFKISIEAVWN